MQLPDSWARVCIVNDAINIALKQERFKSRFQKVNSLRLRRIRAAAWAPLFNLTVNRRGDRTHEEDTLQSIVADADPSGANGIYHSDTGTTRTSTAEHDLSLPIMKQMLAVSNDCGGIYILDIFSPFTNTQNIWDACVLEMYLLPTHDFMVQNNPQNTLSMTYHDLVSHQDPDQSSSRAFTARPSLLATALDKVNFIEEISWSPWGKDNNDFRSSILTIKRSGVLSHLVLQAVFEQGISVHSTNLRTRKQALLKSADRSAVWLHSVCLRTFLYSYVVAELSRFQRI